MKREQLIFLSAGVVFGFVLGFVIAWGMGNVSASAPGGGAPASAPRRGGTPMTGGGSGEVTMANVQSRMAFLRERIERDPKDAEALVEMGNLYMQAGMLGEARAFLERAIEASPDDVHVLTHLGLVLGQTGDFAGARGRFERAVALDPSFWEGWYYLAATLIRMGDREAAREAIGHVEQLNPALPELAELKASLAENERGSP